MRIKQKTAIPGVFIARPNRFVALVSVGDSVSRAHIATSGRLHELLVPGARVLLERAPDGRRTEFSLRAVEYNGVLVSIDAQLPNRLLEKALKGRELPPFADCEFLRREPAWGSGRLDFLLLESGNAVYIEVKSVTLVEGKTALFPDAPTERGRRHLHSLLTIARGGQRAAVIFVVQREDAAVFAPNSATDPYFAAALQEAVAGGVEVYAYRCRVEKDYIELLQRLPVMV
ncbi:MAG: DNA/RNA nuclease SfsA [Dethiobacter sp.]|jgi:sugar fermentation stimulation protein A|nr:DNA/RNA nuclease SfsA [Dethiobacter sp.]